MFNLIMNVGSKTLYFCELIPATKRQRAIAVYDLSPVKAVPFRSRQEAEMMLSALTEAFHTYHPEAFFIVPVAGSRNDQTAISA